VTTKEYDNLCYAIIADTYITAYKQGKNVVLSAKMKWYLSNIATQLRKILKHYPQIEIPEARLLKAIAHLKKHAERQAIKPGGEQIALTNEDLMLITMLDTIMFAYSEAVEKSKSISEEVKKAMKMANSFWQGFEKYIIEGAR
jgi:hypothetical protein